MWFLLDRTQSLLDIASSFLDLPYPVFLESALVEPGRRGFSYLTADPFLILRSKGRSVQVETESTVRLAGSDPFVVLQDLLSGFSLKRVKGLPPFQGGAVGYMAYELGRSLEDIGHVAPDDLGLPETYLGFYDWVIAHDHSTKSTWAVATGFPEGSLEKAAQRLQWVRDRLSRRPPRPRPLDIRPGPRRLESNFCRKGYVNAVNAVRDYIVSGDVYQVNLSQRFETPLPCQPWELYLRLRNASSAPYAAYLQYPEVTVLSASPELFLHLENRLVSSNPMKGTRPRGATAHEDRRLAAELLASEKDRAENLMIVDVVRNDLGKVCTPGSIDVPQLFEIEKYPTVFQMVSAVRGRTAAGIGSVDALRACFPGASVTGAPKIRAMQIINELEPTQRSVYCGAIGYLGFDGSLQVSMPIRILLAMGQKVYVPVGGGIVYDSEPDAEYEETLDKARGSFTALGM